MIYALCVLTGTLFGFYASQVWAMRDIERLRRHYLKATHNMLKSQHAYDQMTHLCASSLSNTPLTQQERPN